MALNCLVFHPGSLHAPPIRHVPRGAFLAHKKCKKNRCKNEGEKMRLNAGGEQSRKCTKKQKKKNEALYTPFASIIVLQPYTYPCICIWKTNTIFKKPLKIKQKENKIKCSKTPKPVNPCICHTCIFTLPFTA